MMMKLRNLLRSLDVVLLRRYNGYRAERNYSSSYTTGEIFDYLRRMIRSKNMCMDRFLGHWPALVCITFVLQEQVVKAGYWVQWTLGL